MSELFELSATWCENPYMYTKSFVTFVRLKKGEKASLAAKSISRVRPEIRALREL